MTNKEKILKYAHIEAQTGVYSSKEFQTSYAIKLVKTLRGALDYKISTCTDKVTVDVSKSGNYGISAMENTVEYTICEMDMRFLCGFVDHCLIKEALKLIREEDLDTDWQVMKPRIQKIADNLPVAKIMKEKYGQELSKYEEEQHECTYAHRSSL